MRPNAMAAALVVNLALAAGLVFLWTEGNQSRWTEPQALPPSLDDVLVVPSSVPVEISQYRETIERPLFASTRKIAPPSAAAADGQATVDPLKDMRLLGTYGVGDRGGIVVISGGKVQRVAVGESIGEWKVVGEQGRGAALVRANGERRQLELALNTTAPSAAAGKAGAEQVKQGADADQSQASGGAQPAVSRTAPAQSSSAADSDAREQLRRQRLERLNARRAQRGLPPLSE